MDYIQFEVGAFYYLNGKIAAGAGFLPSAG